MKATKDKETTKAVKKTESLMPVETMASKVKIIQDKLPELDKMSLELKITTPEILTIAENNAANVVGYLKEVENTRVILKEPYLATSKAIDSYFKTVTDMLTRIKVRITSEIANYKVVQEAAARVEKEAKDKELEVKQAEMTEENAKINRIEVQLNARIYGGNWQNKNGENKQSSGCIKSSDCDDLSTWLDGSLPKEETFKYFSELYSEMVRKIRKRLAEHKASLLIIEAEHLEPYQRTKALEKISEKRAAAEVESKENFETTDKKIGRAIKKEDKANEAVVADAGKGIRGQLKYTVVDELSVTRDLLSVDESKIYSFINENREKIKEDLHSGRETLPGIKFYIDDQYVVR
jgi:hypothetical protein